MTGVVVEIDTGGVRTFHHRNHGHYRPFSEMTQLGLTDWGPRDEIGIYEKSAGWECVHDRKGGEGNA
jgi:hypothetical protein